MNSVTLGNNRNSLPPLLTLTEFLALQVEPTAYAIDKLLPLGGLSILAAHPKAGKSTIVRNMMRAVIQGTSFFNRSVTQGKVLYYVLEEPAAHVADEFRAMHLTSSEVFLRVGSIERPEMLGVLNHDIQQLFPRLVLIDPLFDAIAVDDVNNYGIVNKAMKGLLHVVRGTDTHIVTVHHTNKSDLRGGLSILGSQALAGSTDCNMFLTLRADGARLFETQQRVGRPIALSTLTFDEQTRQLSLEENVRESRIEDLAETLLTVLEPGMSTTEWRAKVKGKNTEKKSAIELLIAQGRIVGQTEGSCVRWKSSLSL